jgi:lipopolysaccharide biosynthesis protein
MRDGEIQKLPNNVRVFIRENRDYDFWSYRQGIFELLRDGYCGTITLLNSSFVATDSTKLLKIIKENECFGISGAVISDEKHLHLQSWALNFSKTIIGNSEFLTWWRDMVQIDDREIVKEKYEIGLSQFLLKRGFQIKCWIDLQQKNPYLEKTNVIHLSTLANMVGLSCGKSLE